MKPIVLVALLAPSFLNAAILRVNNNPLYDPDYADLQLAVDGANPFDTIHVEPSPDSYGIVSLDIPLTLIGPGFKLGTSAGSNPGLQANSQTAMVDLINFDAGSEGSHITGLHFTFSGLAQFNDGAGNYVVSRCYFDQGGVSFNNLDLLNQVLITQCYINGGTIGSSVGSSGVQSNIFITNTYLFGAVEADPALASDWVVAHNVFDGLYTIALWDAEINDNIFHETDSVLEVGNSIHHNLMASQDGTLPTGPGLENYDGLDIADLCVLTGSDDARWHLTPIALSTYPASDGTERGMYGGASPYRPSGVPAVPSIYMLQWTSPALEGGTIDVSVGTRTNN